MNGAQSLTKALVDAGITTCFANPGTSEMQLVYEIGMTGKVRPVLCLQEDVVTGAADGYARMTGAPAFTLLHVGSGFANGIAMLHNAGRANTPIVNIVGANASYHQPNYPEHELIGGRDAKGAHGGGGIETVDGYHVARWSDANRPMARRSAPRRSKRRGPSSPGRTRLSRFRAADDRNLRHDRLPQAAMALVVSAFRMAWVTSTVPGEPPRTQVFGPVSRIAPVAVRMVGRR